MKMRSSISNVILSGLEQYIIVLGFCSDIQLYTVVYKYSSVIPLLCSFSLGCWLQRIYRDQSQRHHG